MHYARGTFIMLAISGLLACTQGQASPDAATAGSIADTPATATSPDSLLKAFEYTVLRLGHSRDSIARRLGPAAVVDVVEADNADGGRDSLITMQYPSITFHLRKPLANGREYFSNVIVCDTGFVLPGRVTPGRTLQVELASVLGEPHRIIAFGDSVAYTYDIPSGPVLQFYFLGDVLRKVRWVYELG